MVKLKRPIFRVGFGSMPIMSWMQIHPKVIIYEGTLGGAKDIRYNFHGLNLKGNVIAW